MRGALTESPRDQDRSLNSVRDDDYPPGPKPCKATQSNRKAIVCRHRTVKYIENADIARKEEFFEVLTRTAHGQLASMMLEPGQSSGEYGTDHPQADQFLIVIDGQGEALIEGEPTLITKGDAILIEAGEKHQITGTGDRALRTLNVYTPPAY